MSKEEEQIVELSHAGKFKVGKTLGRGGFGKVLLVNRMNRSLVTPEMFALKVIKCEDESAIATALKEAQTLLNIKHENIVQLVDVGFKTEGSNGTFVLLLTEYCPGGDLNKRLKHGANPSQKLEWIYQLASAIDYLHSLKPKIVHRDLKPANVLLTESDDIKVADFGLARQYEALKQLSSAESLRSYYMKSEVGTRAYLAPEVFSDHYTEKVDIFSLGIVFYAILEEEYQLSPNSSRLYGAFVNPGGKTPIGIAMYNNPNSSPAKELLFTETNENYGEEAAERLQEIILDCLMYNPKKRPEARGICRDIKLILDRFNDPENESNSDSRSEDKSDSESGCIVS